MLTAAQFVWFGVCSPQAGLRCSRPPAPVPPPYRSPKGFVRAPCGHGESWWARAGGLGTCGKREASQITVS